MFVQFGSPSHDEQGLTFEEFPPTELPDDLNPFLVTSIVFWLFCLFEWTFSMGRKASIGINWPSLTVFEFSPEGINLTVTAVTGEPFSEVCKC